MNEALQRVQQLELLDDDLVEHIQTAAQRATRYLEGTTFEQFSANPQLQDTVAGCVMLVGSAARDVSDHLLNWLSTVPWRELRAAADWRVLQIRSGENLRAVYDYVRTVYPTAITAMEEFRNPRTE